ncbi:TPA: hypothetical protein EYN65_24010 [Candidatus Poribacteria bacterium]|nr:hypothetical protein [Candidatus Poribacteria bacterium]
MTGHDVVARGKYHSTYIGQSASVRACGQFDIKTKSIIKKQRQILPGNPACRWWSPLWGYHMAIAKHGSASPIQKGVA